MKGVSEYEQYNTSNPVYFGYIILPVDVERNKFIELCYRKERVSILVDRGGGIINDCYIDKDVLQHIEFPDKADGTTVGSPIVYVSVPTLNIPFVIAVLSPEDRTELNKEHCYRIKRFVGGKEAIVEVNGSRGAITFIGDEILLVSNENAFIKSLKTVTMQANTIATIKTNKSTFTMNDSEVNITPSEKFSLFEGKSAMVRGDNNSEVLNDIQSILDNLNNALIQFTSTQNTAIASFAPLAPLAAGYSALAIVVSQLTTTISGLINKINENNSEKCFIT